MRRPTPGQVTRLLADVRSSEAKRRRDAEQELVELLYAELRSLAESRLRRERQGHGLRPTALVNETYLRLVSRHDDGRLPFENRAHFFAAASEAMRRVLVDRARRYARKKRGDGMAHVGLSELDRGAKQERREVERDAEEILAVHEALDQLAEIEPRLADVAKLRYFVGLSTQEVANTLETSQRTVERSWTLGRAFLVDRLRRDEAR